MNSKLGEFSETSKNFWKLKKVSLFFFFVAKIRPDVNVNMNVHTWDFLLETALLKLIINDTQEI